MIFFTKEDKEQLLGQFKGLRVSYQNQFGDFNDRFDEEIQFWDNYFKSELERGSFVYGNSNDESLKRTGLPKDNISQIEWLKTREENCAGREKCYNYRDLYPQNHLDAPNYVNFLFSYMSLNYILKNFKLILFRK